MQNIRNTFFKYVSANILGMIGLSCYILADTFFIAQGVGANGLTALNLAIPVYNFMHGLGLMIGMGGATRYSISKGNADSAVRDYIFTHSLDVYKRQEKNCDFHADSYNWSFVSSKVLIMSSSLLNAFTILCPEYTSST